MELKEDFFYTLSVFSEQKEKFVPLWNELYSLYTSSQRHYHNLNHISNMLKLLLTKEEELSKHLPTSEFHSTIHLLKIACWYHDAIYDPTQKNNEEESARLARRRLIVLGFSDDPIAFLEDLILSTKKHYPIRDEFVCKFFLDIDLSILGSKPEVYLEYSKAIRKEYSFVPEDVYRTERKKVLLHFLDRAYIYYTDFMIKELEDQARLNLTNEIKEL